MRDERTDELKDYSRKQGVLHSEIVLPKDAPEWAKDREKLWNAVERKEDKSTTPHKARVAHELEIALPHELTLERNIWLVKDIIKQEYTRKGLAVDLNIHAAHRDGDQRNIHAHIMYSERPLTAEGFSKTKDRSFQDYHYFDEARDRCEKHIKRHLERHGFKEQADKFSLKSLEEQGIDREPQQHLGPTATQMERRSAKSERGAINHGISLRNQEYVQLKEEMEQIAKDLSKSFRFGPSGKANAAAGFRAIGKRITGRATHGLPIRAGPVRPIPAPRLWHGARKATTNTPQIMPRPRHAPPQLASVRPVLPCYRMSAEMAKDYRAFKAAGLLREWRKKWAAYLAA